MFLLILDRDIEIGLRLDKLDILEEELIFRSYGWILAMLWPWLARVIAHF